MLGGSVSLERRQARPRGGDRFMDGLSVQRAQQDRLGAERAPITPLTPAAGIRMTLLIPHAVGSVGMWAQDSRRTAATEPRSTWIPTKIQPLETRRGAEQVGDALPGRWIGRIGNTAPVQGAQELGDAVIIALRLQDPGT
jgi:hypothetical protein